MLRKAEHAAAQTLNRHADATCAARSRPGLPPMRPWPRRWRTPTHTRTRTHPCTHARTHAHAPARHLDEGGVERHCHGVLEQEQRVRQRERRGAVLVQHHHRHRRRGEEREPHRALQRRHPGCAGSRFCKPQEVLPTPPQKIAVLKLVSYGRPERKGADSRLPRKGNASTSERHPAIQHTRNGTPAHPQQQATSAPLREGAGQAAGGLAFAAPRHALCVVCSV